MRTRKKEKTCGKSERGIEDILQRASLLFTPDDFVTMKEESNQKPETEDTIE